MSRVSNVLDAVKSVAHLSDGMQAPTWLGVMGNMPLASEIIACANGLLHLPTGVLWDLTPAFFSLNALDFAFNEDAPAPAEWLRFLDSLWGNDAESIETLQEWFGYCLTGDTSRQKILLMVGPTRSGKGTIVHVLEALLGKTNVCAPGLATLSQQFGRAVLIGKLLATITDARLSGRADHQAIAEQLLSISGGDSVSIERKYLPPWRGILPTRFTIMTNELPKIPDASGALAGRFIILNLHRSFYGCEDLGLLNRLLPEMPSILNWAIAGWDRLQKRGYFRQPEASAETVRKLRDLTSPVGAFVEAICETGRPVLSVNRKLLFAHWRVWCEDEGRDHPGTMAAFGTQLCAFDHRIREIRPRDGGDRERRYGGIGLREDIPFDVEVRAKAIFDARERNY
jgi:putative DNA primase/helicase